jgi:hypothetical protein
MSTHGLRVNRRNRFSVSSGRRSFEPINGIVQARKQRSWHRSGGQIARSFSVCRAGRILARQSRAASRKQPDANTQFVASSLVLGSVVNDGLHPIRLKLALGWARSRVPWLSSFRSPGSSAGRAAGRDHADAISRRPSGCRNPSPWPDARTPALGRDRSMMTTGGVQVADRHEFVRFAHRLNGHGERREEDPSVGGFVVLEHVCEHGQVRAGEWVVTPADATASHRRLARPVCVSLDVCMVQITGRRQQGAAETRSRSHGITHPSR